MAARDRIQVAKKENRMKAFIVTAVLPNEWDRDMLLKCLNEGIQRFARNNRLSETGATIWSVTIKEEFDLKRQDV